MVKDTLYGQMANSTSVSSKKISDMEKANSSGEMEESMKEAGSVVSRAESDITRTITEYARRECGSMESVKSGLKYELELVHFLLPISQTRRIILYFTPIQI